MGLAIDASNNKIERVDNTVTSGSEENEEKISTDKTGVRIVKIPFKMDRTEYLYSLTITGNNGDSVSSLIGDENSVTLVDYKNIEYRTWTNGSITVGYPTLETDLITYDAAKDITNFNFYYNQTSTTTFFNSVTFSVTTNSQANLSLSQKIELKGNVVITGSITIEEL